MSLGDVVGGAGLQLFAQVALVLFTGAFLAVLLGMVLGGDDELFERARSMPLAPEADAEDEREAHG